MTAGKGMARCKQYNYIHTFLKVQSYSHITAFKVLSDD